MSSFFDKLVKEREKNGTFDNIEQIESRMQNIAKEIHFDRLFDLELDKKIKV